MKPKAFELLEQKGPEELESLCSTYGEINVDGTEIKKMLQQILEYAYENRDKGQEIEKRYSCAARTESLKYVLSSLFREILRDEDRFTFWRIYRKATQWFNMKHRNSPDLLIDFRAMEDELGLSDNQVIMYAGELNKQTVDSIILDETLSEDQRLNKLRFLLRKSESVYSDLTTPLKSSFEEYVSGWIRKIEGKDLPKDKSTRQKDIHVTPKTPFEDYSIDKDLTTTKQKRLNTRETKAIKRYGELFSYVAKILVNEQFLVAVGDNYRFIKEDETLFSYIGMKIHEYTNNTDDEEKTLTYWAYFRNRLSMTNIKRDNIYNCIKRIKNGYKTGGMYWVDEACKRYKK